MGEYFSTAGVAALILIGGYFLFKGFRSLFFAPKAQRLTYEDERQRPVKIWDDEMWQILTTEMEPLEELLAKVVDCGTQRRETVQGIATEIYEAVCGGCVEDKSEAIALIQHMVGEYKGRIFASTNLRDDHLSSTSHQKSSMGGATQTRHAGSDEISWPSALQDYSFGADEFVQSQSVYFRQDGSSVKLLSMYPDGVVTSVSIGNCNDIRASWPTIEKWFDKDYETRGSYQLSGNRIKFSITSDFGTVEYRGRFQIDSLVLTSYSRINGRRSDDVEFRLLTNSVS